MFPPGDAPAATEFHYRNKDVVVLRDMTLKMEVDASGYADRATTVSFENGPLPNAFTAYHLNV
jgi:hypothetical protein